MKQQLIISTDLPHNFLAEKMVISCLLAKPDLVKTISSQLPITAFYFQNHQEIYKGIIYMVDQNESVNVLALATFLQTSGLFQKMGGIKVLLELTNQIPNILYFDKYVELVHEKFLRRGLIQLGYRIVNSSYIENISSENIITELELELLSLTSQKIIPPVSNNVELLNNIFCELKNKFLNPGLSGLSSGFSTLDNITQGFQKSDLIIIAGRPSMGKTALSLNIALNAIKATRAPILFFSLEMSKEQVMYRILAMESNINSKKLKTGQLCEGDWTKLNRLLKLFSKLPLFIEDSSNLLIQDIRAKLKSLTLDQRNISLIIVDYLQLIQAPTERSATRTEELSKITRNLKNLAREFTVPIIALSQLSRNVENRLHQKPVLADLRESGSIEQDADLVLMLSNSSVSDANLNPIKEIDLIIAKHRNGPTGTVKLAFDGTQTKFYDECETYCPEPDSN